MLGGGRGAGRWRSAAELQGDVCVRGSACGEAPKCVSFPWNCCQVGGWWVTCRREQGGKGLTSSLPTQLLEKHFSCFFFFFILVWLLLEFFPRVAATELGALVRGSKMLTPRES